MLLVVYVACYIIDSGGRIVPLFSFNRVRPSYRVNEFYDHGILIGIA